MPAVTVPAQHAARLSDRRHGPYGDAAARLAEGLASTRNDAATLHGTTTLSPATDAPLLTRQQRLGTAPREAFSRR